MPTIPGKLTNPPDLTKQMAQASARNTMAGKAADLNNQMGASSQRVITQPPKPSGFGKLSDLNMSAPRPLGTSGTAGTTLQTAAKRKLRTPTTTDASLQKMAKVANKTRKRRI